MNTRLAVLIGIGTMLVGSVLFFQLGNIGTSALWNVSNEGRWLLPLVGVAALIDSINPCAFSILILTIAFLFSLGRLRSSVLEIGSFYILGIFLVSWSWACFTIRRRSGRAWATSCYTT
ncbi:MAG: hypothetical protein HY322_03440 [Betaproteobacteria bacterium]|nr:hypothetical protein [Betaproteobacteria bacterium]